MKKKTAKIKPGIIKYLLVLPLFLLSFCQSEFEQPVGESQNRQAIDAKVLALMKSAIQSDSDQYATQNKIALKGTITEDDDQCTYFNYPMVFEVFSRDNMIPETKEINSDEELIAFIEAFTFENEVGVYTPNYEMIIYFPIILVDSEGVETVLNNLTELEGTLQMAVEACNSFNSGSDDTSNDGSDDGSNGGTDGGSDDGSNGGSDDDSGDGSDDDSDDDSGDGSDDASGDGSDDDSGDGSDDGSGDGSDDDSGDGSDDGSDDDNITTSDPSDDDNGYKFCGKNNKKVYICHKGKTICVSVNAIWGHMQHHEEDFLGTCED